MNKQQLPIGHVNQSNAVAALKKQMQENADKVFDFQHKCIMDNAKERSTGQVNGQFNGILDKLKNG